MYRRSYQTLPDENLDPKFDDIIKQAELEPKYLVIIREQDCTLVSQTTISSFELAKERKNQAQSNGKLARIVDYYTGEVLE